MAASAVVVMELRVQSGVAGWVRERGGSLFVWTATRRCCSGPLTLLETATEPPAGAGHLFRRLEWGEFDLFLDAGGRREPRALVLELSRRRTRVDAFWNDLAWVE
jgi:hypothetical protein